MTRGSLTFPLVLLALVASTLGCSLLGRVVEDAAGGALSTLEAIQPELDSALATLPALLTGEPGEIPGMPPGLLQGTVPAATDDGPPALDMGGAISGRLSYPSEGIPPLKVVAFDMTTHVAAASVETEAGQSTYSLSLPGGIYNVVAYTLDGKLAGGYTTAVLCGLSAECTDHTLLPVAVANGLAMGDIDPVDWYAPADAFPPAP